MLHEPCLLNISAATRPSGCCVRGGRPPKDGTRHRTVESKKVFERKCTPGTCKATFPPSTMWYIIRYLWTSKMAPDRCTGLYGEVVAFVESYHEVHSTNMHGEQEPQPFYILVYSNISSSHYYILDLLSTQR